MPIFLSILVAIQAGCVYASPSPLTVSMATVTVCLWVLRVAEYVGRRKLPT